VVVLVKVKGAKNIKFYGGEVVTVLNPCHVSTTYYVVQ